MLHTHIAIIYNDDIRVIDYIYTYIHIQLYIYMHAQYFCISIDWDFGLIPATGGPSWDRECNRSRPGKYGKMMVYDGQP